MKDTVIYRPFPNIPLLNLIKRKKTIEYSYKRNRSSDRVVIYKESGGQLGGLMKGKADHSFTYEQLIKIIDEDYNHINEFE